MEQPREILQERFDAHKVLESGDWEGFVFGSLFDPLQSTAREVRKKPERVADQSPKHRCFPQSFMPLYNCSHSLVESCIWSATLPFLLGTTWTHSMLPFCFIELLSSVGHASALYLLRRYSPVYLTAPFFIGGLLIAFFCDCVATLAIFIGFNSSARNTSPANTDTGEGHSDSSNLLHILLYIGILLLRVEVRMGWVSKEWGETHLQSDEKANQEKRITHSTHCFSKQLFFAASTCVLAFIVYLHVSVALAVAALLAFACFIHAVKASKGFRVSSPSQNDLETMQTSLTGDGADKRTQPLIPTHPLWVWFLAIAHSVGVSVPSSPLFLAYLASAGLHPATLGFAMGFGVALDALYQRFVPAVKRMSLVLAALASLSAVALMKPMPIVVLSVAIVSSPIQKNVLSGCDMALSLSRVVGLFVFVLFSIACPSSKGLPFVGFLGLNTALLFLSMSCAFVSREWRYNSLPPVSLVD